MSLALTPDELADRLAAAIDARAEFFDERHEAGCRLFNGFYEGYPDLALDLYARTLVIHDYADPPQDARALITAREVACARLPWIETVVLKTRHATNPDARRGIVLAGEREARWLREYGVRYALALREGRDTGFYFDTRNARAWALRELDGRRVLNTFAYTGSFGVAALAGGARHVVQLDLDKTALNVAKESYALNGLPVARADFLAGDFWTQVNTLKRADRLFDCVFLDPPLFAVTTKGRVDLVNHYDRLLNKVRPLVAHEGYLVAINNAVFVSGAEYLATLEQICADGYLALEGTMRVPHDVTGYPETVAGVSPTDPAPFNHATKIAVLRVRRKDKRRAE